MFELISICAFTGSLVVGLELLNYISYLRTYNFAKKKRYFDTPVDIQKIEDLILDDMDKTELETLIQNSISYNCTNDDKYYSHLPLIEIPRNKMIKWTSYYIYFKSMWQLSDEQIEHSKNVLNKIEEKLGIIFPDKQDPNVYFLKFGNNRLECKYRPSIVYGILNMIKHYSYMNMRWNGLQLYTMERSKMKYFYFKNENSDKNVIFLHGLGLGITPYLSYIRELKETCNLIVPIFPNISNMENVGTFCKMKEENFFPSYNTIREDFKDLLDYHKMRSADVISHSFGTIVLGIMMRDEHLARRLNKKVFMDPVCFIDGSYKIFRYINEQGNSDDSIVNGVFNLLVYNDIYVRYVSQRYLYGPEFWVLDYNQLNNNKSLIVLSTDDNLVPSSSIYERCKKHDITCLMVNNANHADIFLLEELKGVWDTIKVFINYCHQ